MTLKPEMIDHIMGTAKSRSEVIEKAYALGIEAGHNVSLHTQEWNDTKLLKSAITTIEQQNKFMAQLSQLVFEHKSLDARMLCLDHGWCINCYTYTCHGDCG